MKPFVIVFFLFCYFNPVSAEILDTHELSTIHSIDDYDYPRNYVEVSEEGLPSDHYLQLIQLMNSFRFTLLPETKVRELFEQLKKDPNARNKQPGGRCSYRRAYIQNLLKKMNIVSGKLLINCPSKNGRLRLRDQVSGRYYTYANFHDSNIVAINSASGPAFRVMDLQFQSSPASLHDFLTEIESSQRIRPLKRKGNGTGLCYWTISTPSLTY